MQKKEIREKCRVQYIRCKICGQRKYGYLMKKVQIQ